MSTDTSVVVYITSSDPRFRAPKGVAIADTLEAAHGAPGGNLVINDGGCAVSLRSGWIARIADHNPPKGSSCDELLGSAITFFETRFDMESGKK